MKSMEELIFSIRRANVPALRVSALNLEFKR
jgi:hypothetical protein